MSNIVVSDEKTNSPRYLGMLNNGNFVLTYVSLEDQPTSSNDDADLEISNSFSSSTYNAIMATIFDAQGELIYTDTIVYPHWDHLYLDFDEENGLDVSIYNAHLPNVSPSENGNLLIVFENEDQKALGEYFDLSNAIFFVFYYI